MQADSSTLAMKLRCWAQYKIALKQMIQSAHHAEMNGKVSTGDKLGFKYYTYFSIFTIGNTLLAASYLLAKPQWRTIPRVPPLLFGVMFVAYMGYFDWEAKVFVHRLEVERNETAYYFRRLLLDKLANHPNIKPRVARLQKLNAEFESLYVPQ